MSEEKILAWHFTEGTTLRDDSLAEVWRARRLRAEYKRDKLKRGAA